MSWICGSAEFLHFPIFESHFEFLEFLGSRIPELLKQYVL